MIEGYFVKSTPPHNPILIHQVPLDPAVSVAAAFDNLLIQPDHPSRSESDTFYIAKDMVLRPQATTYQREVLEAMRKRAGGSPSTAIWSCDVYRRDEVDRTHSPVFHQMDGVRVWHPSNPVILSDLQETLEGLVKHLWSGRSVELRWDKTATFPFTDPSLELEMREQDGPWVEVLGAGCIRSDLLQPGEGGWAFGIGLERIAMLLWGIDDIRLFWSEDERWSKQWLDIAEGSASCFRFKPFSSYPAIEKDLSFWTPRNFQANEFFEFCREIGGQDLEEVKLVDRFEKIVDELEGVCGSSSSSSPYTKTSHCYRFTYRSFYKTLTHEEVNEMQDKLRRLVVDRMGVELR